MRRSIALFAAVLFVGLAVGAAVGASSVPKISACVEKDGTMRYLASGKCRTGEKLLAWNVQGVQGTPGAAGPQGVAGKTGPAGASEQGGSSAPVGFYFADGGAGGFNGGATVTTLKVPAGLYQISGGLISTSTPYTCAVMVGSSDVDGYWSFNDVTTIGLVCSTTQTKPVNYTHAEIFATPEVVLPSLP